MGVILLMKQISISQLLALVFVAGLVAAVLALTMDQRQRIAEVSQLEQEQREITQENAVLELRISSANRAAVRQFFNDR